MRLATIALAATLAACLDPRTATAQPRDGAARAGPWSVDLLDESGNALPTFFRDGRVYVLGKLGRRYGVHVRNGSPRRVEVVVSVDGRDVVDGRPASWSKNGYVLNPWGEIRIDGFRLSRDSVAAFRFGTVSRSYASRMGDARDVGVIGVAVFPERERRPEPLAVPQAPGDAAGARSEAAGAAAEAAPAPRMADARRKAERPGLGTEFGESRESRVVEVAFERARPQPDAVLSLRYDDRDGLLALGIDVDGRGHARQDEAWRRESANPFRESGFAQPPPGWGR